MILHAPLPGPCSHPLSLDRIETNRSGNPGMTPMVGEREFPGNQSASLRVIRGSILDIAVDVRRGSPSYGRHVAVTLEPASRTQLWVPIGFLHGFCTLEDDTQVCYKVSEYYSPEHDAGVYWNDADLKIDWPVNPEVVVLSDKDQRQPRLAELPDFFIYREASPGGKLSAI